MANALFDSAKELFLTGGINLSSDTIKVALVDHGVVTPLPGTHDYYDDISSAVVGTPQTLASKTTTDGVFDAADVTFTSVSGSSCESIVIYKDTGSAATSPLIAFFDTGVTGLPVTPNGGDITIAFNASGIFSI